MTNLFIIDNNHFYEITVLKLISSKYQKNEIKFVEKKYNQLYYILTIIKSISINILL